MVRPPPDPRDGRELRRAPSGATPGQVLARAGRHGNEPISADPLEIPRVSGISLGAARFSSRSKMLQNKPISADPLQIPEMMLFHRFIPIPFSRHLLLAK